MVQAVRLPVMKLRSGHGACADNCLVLYAVGIMTITSNLVVCLKTGNRIKRDWRN